MHCQRSILPSALSIATIAIVMLTAATPGFAQADPQAAPPAVPQTGTASAPGTFKLGEIVTVVGTPTDPVGVGGTVITESQMRAFDKTNLEDAVSLVPGVSGTLDSNGRRNESDIFVRGFGRWQVPLMVDGVRIYLPADNRLDFSRFLTTDVSAIKIRKDYASVLDGPGAMGGSINLVTRKPTKRFESEAGIGTGGRDETEGWNGYVIAGTRHDKFYAQGSASYVTRDFWSLSANYAPTATSLQPAGRRTSSDSRDWRANVKFGFTPNATDEYTLNYTKQSGEKGGPLNVYNNPPVPANAFWRWPYWDVQNTSFLSHTQLGRSAYVKTKISYSTFANGLKAYDDATFTTQNANGRFDSPYDDWAYGATADVGKDFSTRNTLKASVYYRTDVHNESQTSRPTNAAAKTVEPNQRQAQNSSSIALENTFHASSALDLVVGVGYERYAVTRAEEYNTTVGLFEYPRGGADGVDLQAAAVWRHPTAGEFHVSVSDRGRFPIFFELYSTRFGSATPNPNLGPERATNYEVGWKRDWRNKVSGGAGASVSGAVFYSDVRDLIQTVSLPDATTQTQNVGNGHFNGAEFSIDSPVGQQLHVGVNYTFIHRVVKDALQPNLQATGVPDHKGFIYVAWRPVRRLTITPNFELASDRWSDKTTSPVTAIPYVRTGSYQLFNLDATYAVTNQVDATVGFKNVDDQYYELTWGLPQAGRTYYVKTRVKF